ncbi:hypothetical protein S010_005177 [Salmonella enterica subsp. enterica serovar Oranienburg]|nr:hypothetical protein [Salmonella enterica subsp. enterica serovar Oranienburg]
MKKVGFWTGNVVIFLSMPVSEGKLPSGNNSFFLHEIKTGNEKNRDVFIRAFMAGQVSLFFQRNGIKLSVFTLFTRAAWRAVFMPLCMAVLVMPEMAGAATHRDADLQGRYHHRNVYGTGKPDDADH